MLLQFKLHKSVGDINFSDIVCLCYAAQTACLHVLCNQRIGAGVSALPAARMKNMSSLLAKSLRGLKSNCRILLTGTPVQNALQDRAKGVGVGRFFGGWVASLAKREYHSEKFNTPVACVSEPFNHQLPALLGQHLNCVIVSYSLHMPSSLGILNSRRTCGLSWTLHNLVCWETMPRWDTWKDVLSHFWSATISTISVPWNLGLWRPSVSPLTVVVCVEPRCGFAPYIGRKDITFDWLLTEFSIKLLQDWWMLWLKYFKHFQKFVCNFTTFVSFL